LIKLTPVIGNGWGSPEPDHDTEHYWKRARGTPIWESLCGNSLDPVNYLFDTPYIELHYAKDRGSITVCSDCLAAYMDDPDRTFEEVVCPDPKFG
jgi:hypothetical protein